MEKTVIIELDKPRTARLNLFAQMQFEKASGGRTVGQQNGSATDMATFIWACLVQEDESLTVDDVAQMIDVDDIDDVIEKIDSLVEEDADPLAEDGSTDGPSPDTISE